MFNCRRLFRQRFKDAFSCPCHALGWFLVGFILSRFFLSNNSPTPLPDGTTEIHQDLSQQQGAEITTTVPLLLQLENETIGEEIAGDSAELDMADLLSKNVRILCLILTTAKYHETRAIFVKKTWGGRCSKLVFMSDVENATLGAIKASPHSDYQRLWSKVRGGFQWAYDNHLDDFDWFLKADDDSYYIMENLRRFLVDYNPKEAFYFGHEIAWPEHNNYCSGGAGYVLSWRALKRVVEDSFTKSNLCSSGDYQLSEDMAMGQCLRGIGVLTTDSRDHVGRQRFLPLKPGQHLKIGHAQPNNWFLMHDRYPYKEGEECCSEQAISFHYITADEMMELEYMIYRLQPFGLKFHHQFSEQIKNLKTFYGAVI